jgi:beta-lactam-binding protein with PASTA domain
MKRGCLQHVFFGALLLLVFGSSTYFSFTFFVKGRSLPTPNLIGRSVSDARKLTQDLGVELLVDEQHRRNDDKVPVGHIVWQNRTPGATSFIKRGSTMRVELSAGPLVLRVPDLAGATAGTAILRLGQQNLKPGNVTYIGSDSTGVLAADPPKATVVAPQSGVSLLVGVPPPPAEYVMPDLIDRPLEDVRPTLGARGLNVATVKYEAYPGIADGTIIRQYPLRGARVSTSDSISLVVSRQEEGGFAPVPPPPPAAPVVPPTGTP